MAEQKPIRFKQLAANLNPKDKLSNRRRLVSVGASNGRENT